jgi:hypothetical protein
LNLRVAGSGSASKHPRRKPVRLSFSSTWDAVSKANRVGRDTISTCNPSFRDSPRASYRRQGAAGTITAH